MIYFGQRNSQLLRTDSWNVWVAHLKRETIKNSREIPRRTRSLCYPLTGSGHITWIMFMSWAKRTHAHFCRSLQYDSDAWNCSKDLFQNSSSNSLTLWKGSTDAGSLNRSVSKEWRVQSFACPFSVSKVRIVKCPQSANTDKIRQIYWLKHKLRHYVAINKLM